MDNNFKMQVHDPYFPRKMVSVSAVTSCTDFWHSVQDVTADTLTKNGDFWGKSIKKPPIHYELAV